MHALLIRTKNISRCSQRCRLKPLGMFAAIVAVIAATGCPPEASNRNIAPGDSNQILVEPGDWMFVMYSRTGDLVFVGGLRLLPDGTTDRFVIGGEMVPDATGWWQDGGTFYLEREIGSALLRYIADVTTPTQLAGRMIEMRRNVEEGTFIAVRIDERL